MLSLCSRSWLCVVCVGTIHSVWWSLLWLKPRLCAGDWFSWGAVWPTDTTATFREQRLRHSCWKVENLSLVSSFPDQAWHVIALKDHQCALSVYYLISISSFLTWRWTTPDISTWARVGKDPQPFNLYMFRGNNPISKIHQVKEYVTGNKSNLIDTFAINHD